MASHLIRAGGKRQRPAFAVAAGACAAGEPGPVPRDVVLGGVSVELVHLGSLYHDDVIDEAVTRRTVESVNARWGNLRAILAGDFLLAKASEIAASLGTEVAGLLAATIGRLCEGEVRELEAAYDVSRTEEAYLLSIDGKTASLFSAAARIGGIVAGLPREHIDALTTFGTAYGTAFQIVDDILDVVATDEQLGKPAGHDLVEGVYSLPVLRALAGPEGDALRTLLGRPIEGADVERARQLVQQGTAVDEAIDEARGWCDRAVSRRSPTSPTAPARWRWSASPTTSPTPWSRSAADTSRAARRRGRRGAARRDAADRLDALALAAHAPVGDRDHVGQQRRVVTRPHEVRPEEVERRVERLAPHHEVVGPGHRPPARADAGPGGEPRAARGRAVTGTGRRVPPRRRRTCAGCAAAARAGGRGRTSPARPASRGTARGASGSA